MINVLSLLCIVQSRVFLPSLPLAISGCGTEFNALPLVSPSAPLSSSLAPPFAGDFKFVVDADFDLPFFLSFFLFDPFPRWLVLKHSLAVYSRVDFK